MGRVQAPIVPVIAELIRAHPGTISLGQGVVRYPPPPEALAAAGRFAAAGAHVYGHVQGLPELIAALADKLRTENGIEPAGRALVVTAGANMGFLNAVLAITDPGDEIVLLGPYYFNHEMAVTIAGARPVVVATDGEYQPRLEAIEAVIGPRTRAVVTVSPNNPTGAVYSEAALRAVNALCRKRGLYHVSDEAYEYFTYEGARHFSPASIPGSAGHTVALYSFSKAYGLASWRVGCMLVPEGLRESIRKIQDTNLICPPLVCQQAALGALAAGRRYCRPHLAELAEVRALALEALGELGDAVTVPPALGAFYFLVRVRTAAPAMAVAERLVREHRVAVIPGEAFGVREGCALRIAYGALGRETFAEGMGRLVAGLRALVR